MKKGRRTADWVESRLRSWPYGGPFCAHLGRSAEAVLFSKADTNVGVAPSAGTGGIGGFTDGQSLDKAYLACPGLDEVQLTGWPRPQSGLGAEPKAGSGPNNRAWPDAL